MKNLLIFFVLLMIGRLNAQTGVWKAQDPNYPSGDPLFGLVVSIVDQNVAWTIAEGGTCSAFPWNFDLSQNDFSRTTDGGQSWTSGIYPCTPGASIATDIFALNGENAWLGVADFADGHKILHTTDGGQTWIPQNLPPVVYPDFIHFFDNATGIVFSDPDSLGFQVFWTVTGGAGWMRLDPNNAPAALSGEFSFPYHAVQGNHLWAVTNFGRVFHSPSKGLTWESWGTAFPGYADAIACHDNTCLVAFGDYSDTISNNYKSRLFRTTDKGVSWKEVTPPNNSFAVSDMAFVPGSNALIASFYTHSINGPFETRVSFDDGSTWQTIDSGTKILTLFFKNPTLGYGTHRNSVGEPLLLYRYNGSALSAVNTPSEGSELSISPNPTRGLLRLSFSEKVPDNTSITVNDALGRVLHTEILENSGQSERDMDLSGLENGLYFLTVKNGKYSFTKTLLKQ